MPHQIKLHDFDLMMAALRLKTEGTGRPILLLHGGGGPGTVAGLAHALSNSVQVLTPTHPGFDSTSRSERLSSIAELAAFYVQMLDHLDLSDVLVIGSSIGGWIANEMALVPGNRIAGLILIDAVGIIVDGAAVADVFTLSANDMMERVFHAPDKIRSAAPAPTEAKMALNAANLVTLAIYDAGNGMQDPSLAARLASISVPTLVLWGESDRVASTAYGRAYAAGISNASFQIIPEAGHLPQVEQPKQTVELIQRFMAKEKTN